MRRKSLLHARLQSNRHCHLQQCMCRLHEQPTVLMPCSLLQDPFRLPEYLTANPFLPDINNELEVKNATYAANLASLDRLVLYRFEDDFTVVPRGRYVVSCPPPPEPKLHSPHRIWCDWDLGWQHVSCSKLRAKNPASCHWHAMQLLSDDSRARLSHPGDTPLVHQN